MFGFSVTKKGILTDNYFKEIGKYENPEPQGVYIMIRRKGNEIVINQDYHGSYGLYIFKNKDTGFYALSNSFLLLVEYLIGKQNFSFNKDFADNFILTGLCSYSQNETMIKEIVQIPSNAFIMINTVTKKLNIFYKDYEENTIPLESKKGLEIIDKWMDKWGYIFRSLKKKTGNISFDLSGGFDTRMLLTILLNSGIDLNYILINSYKDKDHGHAEDLKIANNISLKYGFKLNNLKLYINSTKWNIEDTLFCTLYSKLGFHKEFYFQSKFHNTPIFKAMGSGGEDLRGEPGSPINKFIRAVSYGNISGHNKEFYYSSMRFLKRNIVVLKKNKVFNNDYEIASSLYSKALGKNHFGKAALEGFISNAYFLYPLMDSELKRIKYDINGRLSHDLLCYIYIRFAPELINFPFQGNRKLNSESIKKAKSMNNNFEPYKIKSDFNENFFIDIKRSFKVLASPNKKNIYESLEKLFDSSIFVNSVKKIYNNNVYKWAKDYRKHSKYFPFRHEYGLLAITVVIENLSLNEQLKNNSHFKINYDKKKNKIINYLIEDNC